MTTEPLDTTPISVIERVQRERLEMVFNGPQGDNALGVKDKLTAMRDLTKTALDQERILVDGEKGKSELELAKAFGDLVSRMGNPYRADPAQAVVPAALMDIDLPEIEPLPGEMSMENDKTDYRAFQERRAAEA